MALASVVRMFFPRVVKKRKMLLNYEIMRVCSLEKGIYVWTIGIDDSKRFGEPNLSEASRMVDSVDFHERYSPRIGYIHSGSPMPFVYDVADLYKSDMTIDLAFKLVSEEADVSDRHVLVDAFCERLVERKVLESFAETVNGLLNLEV